MCVATQRDAKIVGHTIKHIFDALLYQSDLGRAYTEKLEAWKSVSFSRLLRFDKTIYWKLKRFAHSNRWVFLAHPSTVWKWYPMSKMALRLQKVKTRTISRTVKIFSSIQRCVQSINFLLNLESTSSALDPRAGRVDVVVPEIPFDPEDIIKKLEHYKHGPYTNVKSRKIIRKIVDR